jgi:hypothetical protein
MAARPSPAVAVRPAGASSREGDSSRETARPGFLRLSLIALGCFSVGLAWPLLAGLDFVQRPPGTNPVKPVEESDPPPLESEPDSKPTSPTSPPPPRPGTPIRRDEGVRAAAHIAPLASNSSQREAKLAGDAADRPEPSDRIAVVNGQATIVWKAAVVRESPSSGAETRDRLLRGSRIAVTGRKGDWYRVKYGRPVRTGWVHHKALGL